MCKTVVRSALPFFFWHGIPAIVISAMTYVSGYCDQMRQVLGLVGQCQDTVIG